MGNRNIVFHQDWFEAILELPVEKQLEGFMNIFNYGFHNIIPESKAEKFGSIMLAIDRNNRNYAETCKKTSKILKSVGRKIPMKRE